MILKEDFVSLTPITELTQVDRVLTKKDKVVKIQGTLRQQINKLQSSIETLTQDLQNLENKIKQ